MAFRTLVSPRGPSHILKRAYSTAPVPPGGGLVNPVLAELPRPLLGEYRHGVPAPTGPRTARATKVTTLSNGVRVATLSSPDIGASLGLFVGVGPRHETRANAGASHFLKYTAYNSTANTPGFQVVRQVESSGATLTANLGREHLLFSSEFTDRDNAANLVKVLGELLHPRLPYHEVVAIKAPVKEEAERVQHDPVASLLELLHQQAYRSKGLGHSLVAKEDDFHHLNKDTLAKFVDAHYGPGQAVFVGVGTDHEQLVNWVQEALGQDSKKGEAATTEASRYVGGEALVAKSGATHFAIAFEGASLKGDVKEALALGVLQHVLGSVLEGPNVGASIGSGNTSRLASLIQSNSSTHTLSAFNFSYSDSGLFGVYGEASENPSRLVQGIVSEIAKLSNLSGEELNKGKALYKLSVLDQGSKRTPALEFIGAQVLASGKAVTPEDYAAQIDGLTAEDISRVAKKVFASRPTLVAVGDVANMPTAESFRTSLSQKNQ